VVLGGELNIDELVKREAPEGGPYAVELRRVYAEHGSVRSDNRAVSLKEELQLARRFYNLYGPTHYNTALCVVLYELLREAESDTGQG